MQDDWTLDPQTDVQEPRDHFQLHHGHTPFWPQFPHFQPEGLGLAPRFLNWPLWSPRLCPQALMDTWGWGPDTESQAGALRTSQGAAPLLAAAPLHSG